MPLKMQDLIDIEQFQLLQDRLNEIYSFPSSIIDNDGNILTATGWQDICVNFHRKNRDCEKECIKSDRYIVDHILEANPAVTYRCPFGLIDNATPIIIDGVHYGNFFTGQFFLEPPDLDYFRNQARKYGFDEDAYLAAVRKVPIWTRQQLDSYLFFIKGLIEIISGIGLKNLREIENRKKIQESEEQFRAMFETASIGMAQADPQTGRWLRVNPKLCEITGYSSEEMLGMSVPDITFPEDRERDWNAFRRVISGEIADYRLEKRYIRKNGRVVWVNVNMTLIRDDEGRPFRTMAMIEEISSRKEAEGKLRESEERFRKIFHTHQDAIAINRLSDGMYILINEGFTRVTGFTEADLKGRTSAEISIWADPADRERLVEGLRRYGQVENHGANFRQKDGSIAYGIMSASVIDLNGVPHILSVTKDMSDRMRAEERLKESEEKYRILVENAIESIIIAQDGLLKFVNAQTEKLSGYRKEDLIGRPFTDFIHPEDLPMVMQRHVERQKGLEVPSRYSYRLLNASGDTRWVELNVVALEWEGRPATLNFLTDITSSRQAEEEKKALEERLQRSEKMEALGTLAGGVAHDLNNVLGIVIGFSDLLMARMDASSPLRTLVSQVMAGGERAAAIVQDLLTLARRGVNTTKIVNLNAVISDFMKTPEADKIVAGSPGIRIFTDLEPDLLNIMGSPVHLSKTIMNLISNAVEAMPHGGVLKITTANRYLDRPVQGYDTVRSGDYTVVSVSDTGDGIPPGDINRIFEPFYTKKVMGRSGTGLGLAVVWGTVKDHGGYIDVYSKMGRGSTFSLYFPVTRDIPEPEQTASDWSEYTGKGETVLVVDDFPEQRELASGMLTALNYSVAVVSSGEEAVQYLKGNRVDLVLLDMIMDPGIDGLDTYREILKIHPGQKAVIVSGFSETERVRKAQELGAGAYIRKPYVLEKLGLAVKAELARK